MFQVLRSMWAFACTLMIVVSGWAGASFRFFPNLPEASSPAAPTPSTSTPVVKSFNPLSITSLSADEHDSEVEIPVVPNLPDGITLDPHFEGWIEPRYDLPPLEGIEDALCGEWWQLAIEVGWELDDLETLDRIMWAETRCQPDLVSSTHDYGLVQINRAVWREFVEARGYTMNDLLDARTGLMFGLLVAEEAEAMGWCRYQPWYRSGAWC